MRKKRLEKDYFKEDMFEIGAAYLIYKYSDVVASKGCEEFVGILVAKDTKTLAFSIFDDEAGCAKFLHISNDEIDLYDIVSMVPETEISASKFALDPIFGNEEIKPLPL